MKNIIITLVLCLSLLFVTTSVAFAEGVTIQQGTQQNIHVVKKLHLSTTDKSIGGVCGGLGEYFGIDSSFIRIGFVVFTLAGGAGILVYLVMWAILPEGI